MDLLNLLPAELAATVVAEWLEIGDLVRLDSSFTNQAGRAGYLSFLPSSDRAYEVPSIAYDREETCDVVKWIVMRGVKVSNVKFTRAVDEHTFKSFMDTTGDKLIAVHFVAIASEVLMELMACEVAARSRHLTELSLFECPIITGMWPRFGRFPNPLQQQASEPPSHRFGPWSVPQAALCVSGGLGHLQPGSGGSGGACAPGKHPTAEHGGRDLCVRRRHRTYCQALPEPACAGSGAHDAHKQCSGDAHRRAVPAHPAPRR